MHQIEMEVRDNELDIQGVVNNANYFIYLAHARHKFIQELGIDFAQMAQNQQNMYLIESNIQFKGALRSQDIFSIKSKLVAEGKIKFAFAQTIHKADGTLIASAHNICVCMDESTHRKKPYVPQELVNFIEVNS